MQGQAGFTALASALGDSPPCGECTHPRFTTDLLWGWFCRDTWSHTAGLRRAACVKVATSKAFKVGSGGPVTGSRPLMLLCAALFIARVPGTEARYFHLSVASSSARSSGERSCVLTAF